MWHIDIPSRSDIERLTTVREPACLSIYSRRPPRSRSRPRET